jgi:hypothetical protein
MIALPFDTDFVAELVLRLNAITAKEGNVTPDLGGNATDDPRAEALQETRGDLSRDEVTQEIQTLNTTQQDALIALFWIGREDGVPAQWPSLMALARAQHHGNVSRYLLGQPDAGEFLTLGLEQVEEYGLL